MNDRLQARVFNFEDCGVLEERKSTARLEDFFDDIDDSFDGNILIRQVAEAVSHFMVAIDDSIDYSLGLDEEVDVLSRIDVPQEVLVDSY